MIHSDNMLYYHKKTDDFTMLVITQLGTIVETVTHDHLDYLQSFYEKPEYRSWYDLVKDYPAAIPSIKRQLMDDIRNKINVKESRQKLAYLSPHKNKKGQITPDLIQQAKQRQIREFVKVSHSGKIQCMFHSDKVASMHIYPRSYYCFSCQAHGSTIDFIMKQQGKTFKEAVIWLSTGAN